MTVGQDRSRDPRPGGDRPSPPLPGGAPVPAGLSLRPSRLPPPPSAFPPNFFPAFLGFAAPSSARRVGSDFAAAGASSPLSPGLVSPAPRHVRSAVVGPLFLDTSSGPMCDEVNAALSAWRHDGCPATGPLMAPVPGLVSILRAPSAFKARCSKRVRFNIPDPGHLSEAPASPVRLQATSHRLSSPSAAAGGSMDVAPAGEQWTRVLSRRARQEARRNERRDADSLRCPPSNPHPLRRSSPPLHRPPAPRYRPNRRCFRCQAKDHLVASCRDPVRCASCYRWGHRARDCKPPRSSSPSPPPTKPASTTLRSGAPREHAPVSPAPHASSPLDMAVFLGDAASRTEEDTCYIATSFDLDQARLDWERSSIVAWVLSAPSGTDRSDVDDVFRREFRLRSSELTVSRHYPEEYLIKFSTAQLRDKVMRTKRQTFKRDGLEVHFRPWRAVSQAINANMCYRVHLDVDALPPFAWRPEIVDHILGRKCAVQHLDDGFTTMEDTRSFGVWVWTMDPHRIPKVLWLTFANKAPGGLSSIVRVAEDRPDQWKRGMTFRVLLHINTIEDFSSAPVLDGGEPISDFRPSSRTLPAWGHGTVDGRQVGLDSVMPAAIPPLGAERRAPHADGRSSRARSSSTRGQPDAAAPVANHRDTGGRPRSRSTRHEELVADRRSRSPAREDRHRSRSRHGNRCDDREPSHHRRHEDDDDRYDGRGERARRSGTRAPSAGVTGGRRADQERHRSRYNSGGYNGRQHGASTTTLASIVLRTSPVPPLTVAATGVAVDEPLSDAEVTVQLQSLLRTGIANLRTSLPAILGCSSPTPAAPAHSPFQSACRSWTEAIRAAPASLVAGSSRLASPPPCSFALTDAPSAWEEDEEDAVVALRCSPQRRAPVLLMASPPVQVPNCWDDADGGEAWFDADADGEAAALADAVALAPLLSPSQATATTDVTAGVQHAGVITSVEDLFDRPPVAILPAPIALTPAAPLPPPEERRSARLAAKPFMSALDKAIKVLHGKMGIIDPELPLEQARRLYIDSYKTAVPGNTIQALVSLFKLNMPAITAADEALIAMAGPGGSDLTPTAALESTS
ncbi:hypothetical protein QYE76_014035 [Lolium multiflorum]|uniref:CCHC-type domain-containing protein n=1 Tax=Lolium multiflorum TaxID=4521 RepID=A0AAD8X542_LOLMU|nr:hypothetical protein QYE76_014035 [Lolium multiflorum]